jgi:hypothetical protein
LCGDGHKRISKIKKEKHIRLGKQVLPADLTV